MKPTCRRRELNVLVPEWTQQTVERIFATHLEDWPALLRSLRLVGDDVRAEGARNSVAAEQVYSRDLTDNLRQPIGEDNIEMTDNFCLERNLAILGLRRRCCWLSAQDRPTFRVKVDMVVLSFQSPTTKGTTSTA